MASAVSRSACTPGPASPITARAMPASSIAASRSSPKSVSRVNALSRRSAGRSTTVGFQYSIKSGQRKCSSSAILLTMHFPRALREASELPLSVPHNGYSVQTAVLGWWQQNKMRSSVAKTIRGVTFEENENNAMGLEFYNLSHRFGYQSPNWPYFEDVKIERIHYRAKSGVLSQRITTSMHNTTHIDAPAHV